MMIRGCRQLSPADLEDLMASGEINRLKRTLRGALIQVPMRRLTTEYAFSLAPEGWNYIRALVAETAAQPEICLDHTVFFRFFQNEQVRSVGDLNDILFLHDPIKRSGQNNHRFYFGTYPWGHWTRRGSAQGGYPWGQHYDHQAHTMTRDLHGYRRNPWYEPGDRYPLDIEFEQTRALYHSLKTGYEPRRYGSFPTVVLMVRRDGDWRAVRENGHHRLSILSHLAHETVSVMVPKDSGAVVHEADAEQW
jgi:hypothetical protein